MKKISFIMLAFITLSLVSCSNFKEEAKPLFKDLNQLYEISLSKSKITQQVWYTAIYDKKYALSTSNNFDDYYVSDFNVAISRMEEEQTIKEVNSKIDSLASIVSTEVGKVSDKKNESYDKLISLYTNVIELSKKARTPSGNLQSYSGDIEKMENDINKLITELQARNPEFAK